MKVTFAPFDITTGYGDISIAGTVTGATGADVLARRDDEPYQLIASGVSGAFSGTYTTGEGEGALQVIVRESGNYTAWQNVPQVAVGAMIGVGPQSNGSGRGTFAQTAAKAGYAGTQTAYLFGNDYVTKVLVDPYDSASGQLDAVSFDASAGGSYWSLVVWICYERLRLLGRHIPMMLVPGAKGGVASALLKPGANINDRTTLFGSLHYRLNLFGGMNKLLTWSDHQGESGTVSTYTADKIAVSTQVQASFGVKPLIVLKQHNLTSGQSQADQDAIRAKDLQLVADGHYILGPDFYDTVAIGDEFHIMADDQLLIAANLMADKIMPLLLAVPEV